MELCAVMSSSIKGAPAHRHTLASILLPVPFPFAVYRIGLLLSRCFSIQGLCGLLDCDASLTRQPEDFTFASLGLQT